MPAQKCGKVFALSRRAFRHTRTRGVATGRKRTRQSYILLGYMLCTSLNSGHPRNVSHFETELSRQVVVPSPNRGISTILTLLLCNLPLTRRSYIGVEWQSGTPASVRILTFSALWGHHTLGNRGRFQWQDTRAASTCSTRPALSLLA